MTDSESEYVTLVSCDGFEFVIKRSAAVISGTIKNMLNPRNRFQETLTNRCVFGDINGVVLEKVCEYLYYNEKHKETKIAPDMEIPIELSLELLLASDFLDL